MRLKDSLQPQAEWHALTLELARPVKTATRWRCLARISSNQPHEFAYLVNEKRYKANAITAFGAHPQKPADECETCPSVTKHLQIPHDPDA